MRGMNKRRKGFQAVGIHSSHCPVFRAGDDIVCLQRSVGVKPRGPTVTTREVKGPEWQFTVNAALALASTDAPKLRIRLSQPAVKILLLFISEHSKKR